MISQSVCMAISLISCCILIEGLVKYNDNCCTVSSDLGAISISARVVYADRNSTSSGSRHSERSSRPSFGWCFINQMITLIVCSFKRFLARWSIDGNTAEPFPTMKLIFLFITNKFVMLMRRNFKEFRHLTTSYEDVIDRWRQSSHLFESDTISRRLANE